MIRCQTCSFENTSDAKFCENCGKPLERVCPNCAKPVSAEARFCKNCGETLVGQQGPVTQAAVKPVQDVVTPVAEPAVAPSPKPERKFCGLCGEPVNPGAKYCFRCGTQTA